METERCPAWDICKELNNLGYNCAFANPPFGDDNKEITQLKKISFQLHDMQVCLHSIVLLLNKK
jgi:hypothetical protein